MFYSSSNQKKSNVKSWFSQTYFMIFFINVCSHRVKQTLQQSNLMSNIMWIFPQEDTWNLLHLVCFSQGHFKTIFSPIIHFKL